VAVSAAMVWARNGWYRDVGPTFPPSSCGTLLIATVEEAYLVNIRGRMLFRNIKKEKQKKGLLKPDRL